MSTDIKVHLSKIIQLSEFLGIMLSNMMSNLGKKALIHLDVSLAKDVLPKLATKATLPKLTLSKIRRQRTIRTGFTYLSQMKISILLKLLSH